VPRSRRWTTEIGPQEPSSQFSRGTTKWEPTLAFPKSGAHRATIGDRLFAEVHIDIKIQQERGASHDGFDGTTTRSVQPFIESIVYDYLGVENERTLVVRETSRQGERIDRATLYVRLAANGPTKIRFASGVVSVIVDDEQVAIVRWLGP